jgi:sugar/nucleoside kinase (ribokinase family)
MKYDIICIGDAFEDVFVEPDLKVKSDRRMASGEGITFEFGEKIPLESVVYEVGGSAANTAVGFSRLGNKAGIVTYLGNDTPKDRVIERLEGEIVDISNINISKNGQSGFSVIFRMDGNRTIFVYHGLKDYSALKIKKSINSRWYYLAPIGDGTKEIEDRIIEDFTQSGTLLAWNPGSVQIEKGASNFRHLLHITQVLFLNREEAVKFLNYPIRGDLEDVMKRLQMMGPKIVVVTAGKDGAKVYDGKKFYEIKADKNLKVVDSTGAGDGFAVGFLGRLINSDFRNEISEEEIEDALAWGIANSSSVLKFVGGQKGLLSQKDLI